MEGQIRSDQAVIAADEFCLFGSPAASVLQQNCSVDDDTSADCDSSSVIIIKYLKKYKYLLKLFLNHRKTMKL